MNSGRRSYVGFAFLITSVVLVLLLVLGCGDDDCPTCPVVTCENENYDGRLYASMTPGTHAIFAIDTQTDSILDSFLLGNEYHSVAVSGDGKLIAASASLTTYVVDAETFELVTVIEPMFGASFIDGDRFILGEVVDGYTLFSVETYQRLWTYDLENWGLYRYNVEGNAFYGAARPNVLYRFQIDSVLVTDEWIIRNSNGEDRLLRRFDISPDGRRFYGLSSSGLFGAFLIYDLDADSLVSEFPLYGNLGSVRLHPNGREVWVTDPGCFSGCMFYPGTIYIFGADTGEYLEGISLYGYLPRLPQVGLAAQEIEFTPDGSHAYVLTGNATEPITDNVLRIDTRSRQVENLIFPEFDHFPCALAIGPKP